MPTHEREITEPVDLCLPDGRRDVAAGAFAVLDHGRGRWPYSVSWNWAAGSAPGRAVQLGGRWTEADDGAWVGLDGLTGWAEEARNRW